MGGRCRVWSLVLCVAACASRAAAAPSVACHEYAQAACAGEAVHSFVLETGACYSNEEVQGTVGLDADNLTAPFYSWMAVADDALVVPVAFDAFQNNECTDVLNHLTVYDGVVGPWATTACVEVGGDQGWVSGRPGVLKDTVLSAHCRITYKQGTGFEALGIVVYVGCTVYLLAQLALWRRRSGKNAC